MFKNGFRWTALSTNTAVCSYL